MELHAPEKPDFGCGESLPELENRNPAHFEQSLALVQTAPNVWRTPTPLAFRYLRSGNAEQVSCRALFEPAVYRGAFAADPELTEIWMHAAYTLRLCRHHFLIDGVKRDRLPWVGDLALSLLANAYVFGDPAPVRRTLAVLGRAGIREQHLNGIVDYSLWFLICHDLYQRYWGDRDFLELQRRELVDHIEVLLEQSRSGIFLPSAGTWLFIDWVDCPKESALQVLFHWSLQAAERLAERLGESALAGRCREHARQLKSRLFAEAFDSRRGLFFQTPGEPASGFGATRISSRCWPISRRRSSVPPSRKHCSATDCRRSARRTWPPSKSGRCTEAALPAGPWNGSAGSGAACSGRELPPSSKRGAKAPESGSGTPSTAAPTVSASAMRGAPVRRRCCR